MTHRNHRERSLFKSRAEERMSATRNNAIIELRDFWNYHHEPHNHLLKLCIVFDNGASARSAKRLLKRSDPDEGFETTLLRLGLDLLPANRNITARSAADCELLVFALAHDGELPAFAKAWFHLWIALCNDNHERAVAALFTGETLSANSRASWARFLERVADTANFTFFCGHAQDRREPAFVRAALPEQSLPAPRFALSGWTASAIPRGTLRSGINE
jgi:hypothetical protein